MIDKRLGRDHFADRMGISKDKILFSEHHFSQPPPALYLCSPFEESAVLTVDGVGECGHRPRTAWARAISSR